MSPSASLLAEQSIFAQLIVKKQKSEHTKFQKATENEPSIYKYTKKERLTSVNPNEYSIMNLPDTISYIPENSIFSNIILIRSTSPDYRFIPIASVKGSQESMKRVTIASDSDIKVKRFKSNPKKKTKIYTTKYDVRKADDDDNDDNADNDDGNDSSNNTDDENDAYNVNSDPDDDDDVDADYNKDDARFASLDLNNIETYSNLDLELISQVAPIVSTFNKSKPLNSDTWSTALLRRYNFSNKALASKHRNTTTLAARIVDYLPNIMSTTSPKNYTNDDINKIQSAITSYLNNYTQ